MSAESVTAREAVSILLERVNDPVLRGRIADAMDTGKVVKEELSSRRRTKRIEKPSRRVALSELEALQEAVRVFRAAFLEIPAICTSIDTEIKKQKVREQRGKSADLPLTAEVEVQGEGQITRNGPETIPIKPVSPEQLGEMHRLIDRLQSLLNEVSG